MASLSALELELLLDEEEELLELVEEDDAEVVDVPIEESCLEDCLSSSSFISSAISAK